MQQFVTNINCSSCVNAAREVLNELAGPTGWKVDINDASKLLTISSDYVEAADVANKLQEQGFTAKPLVR
jgi:copper chaperone CopZ